MPLYVYECSECNHSVEELQSFDDPAPEVCESCGKKNTMIKQISSSNFELKGGGWYKDGYSK